MRSATLGMKCSKLRRISVCMPMICSRRVPLACIPAASSLACVAPCGSGGRRISVPTRRVYNAALASRRRECRATSVAAHPSLGAALTQYLLLERADFVLVATLSADVRLLPRLRAP